MASKVLPRRQEPVAAGDPFVLMSGLDQILLGAALVMYTALVAAGAMSLDRPLGILVVIAVAILLAVEFAPLLITRQVNGWLHPYAVSGWLFGFYLIRCWPDLAFGLPEHRGLASYTAVDLDRVVLQSLGMFILARLAYYYGYSITLSANPRIRKSIVPRMLTLKCAGIVALSCAACWYYIGTHGGLTAHMQFLARGRSVLTNEGELFGEWTVVSSLGGYACMVWVAVDRSALMKPLFWVALVSALVTTFLVQNARSEAILCLLQVFAIWVLRRRKMVRSGALGILAAAVAAIGLLGGIRSNFQSGPTEVAGAAEVGAGDVVTNALEELQDRAGRGNATYPILARVPSEVPLLYGTSYGVIPASFIPRRLWPEKPRSLGVQVGPTFLGTNSPVPPGPVGEAYWNFHAPGVVFVFVIFGLIHKFAARAYLANLEQPLILPFYAVTLFRFSPDGLGVVQWLHAISSVALVTAIAIGLPRLREARGAW